MRIAVLSFAHLHAIEYVAALTARPDVTLLASDPGHASRPAGESGGPAFAAELGVDYVDDYEDVWAWKPDGVIICAENAEHRVLTLRAVAEGVAVLCEKPLATSLADATEMVQAAQHAGTVLMTALPVRWSPAYAELRAAVRRGALGRIVSIDATNCGGIPVGVRDWFVDAGRSGGGAMTDHLVHVADLLADLLEEEPADVYAIGNSIPNGNRFEVETGGLVSLRFPSGVIASIDCSWSKPPGVPDRGDLVTMSVVGTEGVAEIAPFASLTSGWSSERGTITENHAAPMDALLIDAFLEAVATGLAGQPDGDAGRRTVAVVDAAYRSVAAGDRVAAAAG